MQSLSVEKRWYIIFQWKKGSINVKQIARHLHCHISTVYRIINHYRLHRNVDYQHSTGRSPALNQAEVKTLDKTIRKNRSATAADLLLLTKFNTTERTIQRYRLSLGYRPRISAIKVQTNRKNEEKRYRFAELHYRANIKKYIFEDECYVGLRGTKPIVWCKRGESTPKKEISSLRAHINLIGFIWWNGFVFRRFDNWLNSDTYRDTVKEALSRTIRGLKGFSYISDGVQWHRSVQFRRWCEEKDIELCEWPGYSPDFNAIELVWNIIKQKIKTKNPKSQHELEIAGDEACNSLSLRAVQNCIEKTQRIYLRVVDQY